MLTIESHASQVNDKGGGWVTRKVCRREEESSDEGGLEEMGFGSGVNDDFELKEGDMITEVVGGRMGFNALFNKIHSLWKLKMTSQLMDLENEFYLVKFQGERDYTKALIVGPWLVFGQYLTVQPIILHT
ncbi:hypothetical protein Gohar_009566 [Gossypium harknessii]|uniref:DUF4283 domain-containing protein n=1 Tax=Gossypium harknessii TaxID=34285 RepID=A0A7J9GNA6_9ROSI|nr:hypothetical protein [Gossypium harknessii]